jgi:hypothetical protein
MRKFSGATTLFRSEIIEPSIRFSEVAIVLSAQP